MPEKRANPEDLEETFNHDIPLDLPVDEAPIGLDCDDSADLDIGVEITDPHDAGVENDGALDWSFDGLIEPTTGSSAIDDDDAGPVDFDPAIGVQDLKPGELDDSILGFDTGETFVEPTFNDMASMDEEGPALFSEAELELAEERTIHAASTQWTEVVVQTGRFECALLADQRLLVAGDDLLIVENHLQRRVALPSGIIDLRSFGQSPPRVAATTRSGRLLLLDAPDYSTLRTLEAAEELNRHSGIDLQIASFGAIDSEQQLVLKGETGVLHFWNASKSELQPASLSAHVLLLPVQADRPLCIAKQGDQILLASADSTAGPWHTRGASPKLSQHLQGDTVLLAKGNVVALANPRQGLLLSTDRGETFRSVPGSMAVTQVTAGRYQGTTYLWLALTRELQGKVELVLLDPATLELLSIAQFSALGLDDFAPAQTLVWDEERQTLFAAGEFGLHGFRPS